MKSDSVESVSNESSEKLKLIGIYNEKLDP